MSHPFNAFSSSGISSAALSAALAAKLDKAGGTMTGALTLNLGTLATAGLTHQQTWNSAGTTCRGVSIAITDTASASDSTPFRILGGAAGSTQLIAVDKNGSLVVPASQGMRTASGNLHLGSNGLAAQLILENSSVTTNGGRFFASWGANIAFSSAATPDLQIERAAAASLQLGSNHATTATAQTIKAHNVTTGTGASLILCGGTGSVAGGSVKLAAPSTTGAGVVAVEVGAGGMLGFFGAGAQTQPATGGSSAAFVENAGTALNENSTFDNYTIAQVVTALRNLGLLA